MFKDSDWFLYKLEKERENRMLLNELFEIKEEIAGSYISVKFSEDSKDRLYEFATKLKLENLTPKDKYHVTIIYSTKPVPKDFKANGLYDDPIIVNAEKFDLFGPEKNCLVLKLDAPELVDRNKWLMDTYLLLSDFPEYKAHLTLCYDTGKDFQIPKNIDFSDIKDLEIIEEVLEPLDLNWKEKLNEYYNAS